MLPSEMSVALRVAVDKNIIRATGAHFDADCEPQLR